MPERPERLPRHGDGADERDEYHPPPRLTEEAKRQEVAQFMDEQDAQHQRRDEPAEQHDERTRTTAPQSPAPTVTEAPSAAAADTSRPSVCALMRLSVWPRSSSCEQLRQQRPGSPVILHGQPRAVLLGCGADDDAHQLVVAAIGRDAVPVDHQAGSGLTLHDLQYASCGTPPAGPGGVNSLEYPLRGVVQAKPVRRPVPDLFRRLEIDASEGAVDGTVRWMERRAVTGQRMTNATRKTIATGSA